MSSRVFHVAPLAVLLVASAARAEDGQATPPRDHERDAVHAAMHEAMQQQMAMPQHPAQMPGMTERGAGDAATARDRAARMAQDRQMKQDRDAARQRAMQHGAQDAAMAHGDRHGGMQNGAGHGSGGMMNGDTNTTQQGAGMMRTGTMHGGSDGMMPGGPDKMPMPGGGMGSTGTGTTSGTASGTSGGMSH